VLLVVGKEFECSPQPDLSFRLLDGERSF
jgi:hypothetical protein